VVPDAYSVGCSGIRHGVASISVGHVFVHERSLASGAIFLSVLDCGLDGEDVHAVDLQARNVLATLIVFGNGGGAVRGGTHTIFVV
jgi:hypothetical protein